MTSKNVKKEDRTRIRLSRLRKRLYDQDPEVRIEAARALSDELPHEISWKSLRDALEDHEDSEIRHIAVMAFCNRLPIEKVRESLLEALDNDSDIDVKLAVLSELESHPHIALEELPNRLLSMGSYVLYESIAILSEIENVSPWEYVGNITDESVLTTISHNCPFVLPVCGYEEHWVKSLRQNRGGEIIRYICERRSLCSIEIFDTWLQEVENVPLRLSVLKDVRNNLVDFNFPDIFDNDDYFSIFFEDLVAEIEDLERHPEVMKKEKERKERKEKREYEHFLDRVRLKIQRGDRGDLYSDDLCEAVMNQTDVELKRQTLFLIGKAGRLTPKNLDRARMTLEWFLEDEDEEIRDESKEAFDNLNLSNSGA